VLDSFQGFLGALGLPQGQLAWNLPLPAAAQQFSPAASAQELRAGHLSMAAGWHALALEVEESLGLFNESFVYPGPAAGQLRPTG